MRWVGVERIIEIFYYELLPTMNAEHLFQQNLNRMRIDYTSGNWRLCVNSVEFDRRNGTGK